LDSMIIGGHTKRGQQFEMKQKGDEEKKKAPRTERNREKGGRGKQT